LQTDDWQAIVQTHGPAVWQTGYRLLGNHTDAADCFQEAFLAAVEISRRQRVRNIAGLLVRLATTRAIDKLRQRNRLDRRSPGRLDAEPTSPEADPLELAQRGELAARLRGEIAQLPPQEARVFCLRYLSDMSYGQIARELNIAIGAVGVLLYRARGRLRAALTPPTEEGAAEPPGPDRAIAALRLTMPPEAPHVPRATE
jgi:RNA polymerase sigma-70 factor (ECF subfamily)